MSGPAGEAGGGDPESAKRRGLLLLRALESDLDMMVDVLDAARQIWSPRQVPAWLFTSQTRFGGRSPIEMIIAHEGDQVLDLLEGS